MEQKRNKNPGTLLCDLGEVRSTLRISEALERPLGSVCGAGMPVEVRSRVTRRECRRRDLNSTVPCRRDARSSAASHFDENELEYHLTLNFGIIHS